MLEHHTNIEGKTFVTHKKSWNQHFSDMILWLPLPIAILTAAKIIYQKHFASFKNMNNFLDKFDFIGVPTLIISSLMIIPKIVQLLTRWGVSKAMLPSSSVIFKYVVDPKQEFYDDYVKHPNIPNEFSSKYSSNKFYQVTTHDGAKLDSFITTIHKNVKLAEDNGQPERYLINFNGNAELYQFSFEKLLFWDNKARINPISEQICHNISFNYRGTGNSTGNPSSYADLVNDGIAQVQYLIDYKGVKPENIELYGHSMGGGIAPHVANHFYKRGTPLGGMILSRTYGNLIDTAKHTMPSFLEPLVSPVVTDSRWDNKVIDVVLKLDKNKMPITLIDVTNDEVIGPKGLAKEIALRKKESAGIYAGKLFTSENLNCGHNHSLKSLDANNVIAEHFIRY